MKLAVISTYNTKCGIAEYTYNRYKMLEDELEIKYCANYDVVDRKYADDEKVIRLWKIKDTDYKALLIYLRKWQPNIVHIQAHSAHHSIEGIRNLIIGLANLPIKPKIFITPHIVHTSQYDIESLKQELTLVDRVFVHSLKEYRYLISLELRNVAHFVHPYPTVTLKNRSVLKERLGIDNEPVIVTHGLIAPHKGFTNVIKAFKKLLHDHPNALLVLLTPRSGSNPESENEYQAIKELIKDISGNVLFFDEFLKENELFPIIQLGDIGVLAYEEVGESASGAIRKFLSAGIPTIVSNIPIVEEYIDEVEKIWSNSAENIFLGVKALLGNKKTLEDLREKGLKTARDNTYEIAGKKLLTYYSAST